MKKFIHKWKTFKTDTSPPRSGRLSKFTPRFDRVTFREMADNSRTSPQTLQASVIMLNDTIHDSTVRQIWDRYGMFGRLARRKLLLSKKAWQKVASEQNTRPLTFVLLQRWPEGKYIFRKIVISGLILLMTHPALHRFLSN